MSAQRLDDPMTHEFDKAYWTEHWQQVQHSSGGGSASTANPHLVRETGGLTLGTALDAGCGEGAEALWLAAAGWQVTAVDIAPAALARATERSERSERDERVRWVEADLSTWQPAGQFDLVTTHYAHPAMPQLDFYERIANWVRPGGTLLIVGHLHTHDTTGHDHQPPAEASVTAVDIIARLDDTDWTIVTADEHVRTAGRAANRDVELHDVVVRATRTVPSR